jgi:hypothetical protein
MNRLDRAKRQRIAVGVVFLVAVIDVTRRAAEKLDFVKSGRTKVKLDVVK